MNDLIKNGRGTFLGGTSATAKELLYCSPCSDTFMLEFTITHPHNVSYLNMTSEQQKRKLARILQIAVSALPVMYQDEREISFEFDSHGQIHAHAWQTYLPFKHYPIGVISDVAKAVLSGMPKKYNKFKDNCLNGEWGVYKDAPIKIKYDPLENNPRVDEWKAYCGKLQ